MKYAKILFLIFLVLKPFYIFDSGGIQFADIFLILSAFIALPLLFLNRNKNGLMKEIFYENKLFILFTALATLVNLYYFSTLGKVSFVLSPLYLVFNLIAVMLFSYLGKSRQFLAKISIILEIHLMLQAVIFFLGVGRMYDDVRYMGIMNDPNQFGFFVFIAFLYIYVIHRSLNINSLRTGLSLALTVFLVFLSGSTGMVLGLGVFVAAILCYKLLQIGHTRYVVIQKTMYALAIFVVTFMLIIIPAGLLVGGESVEKMMSNQVLVERVSNKVSSGGTTNDLTFWEDRGYDKLYFYPQYAIFGAGQGEYYRFSKAATDIEIHATLPEVLFVYGIVPCCILLLWMYQRTKRAPMYAKIALLALLVESFTLLNQRQALFWMFIVLTGVIAAPTLSKDNLPIEGLAVNSTKGRVGYKKMEVRCE